MFNSKNANCRVISCLVIGLVMLAFGPIAAEADTIETYTGNPYTTFPVPSSGYTTANSITAMLTFANPLPANATLVDGFGGVGSPTATDLLKALVLSDGTVTYTLSNFFDIWLATGNSGQIVSWYVFACATTNCGLSGSQIDIQTEFNLPPPFPPGGASSDSSTTTGATDPLAYNYNDPGVWTSRTVTTPEPSSLLLGLLGLAVPAGKNLFKRE